MVFLEEPLHVTPWNSLLIKLIIKNKNKGLTRSRTWVRGVRILCDNHYTIRPKTKTMISFWIINNY